MDAAFALPVTRRYNPQMRPAALAVPVMFVTVVALTAARQAPTLPERQLDALFNALHARGLFDGAVVIGSRDEVYARGLGQANAERQVAFTPDTPVDGGSLAKTFTAALLIGLAADGTVDLDAPVRRWLPELPYPAVTIRHLLSHSSGIPTADYSYFDPHLPSDDSRTTERLLRVLAEQKPALTAPPGTAFEYNSFAYDLAALAAARAAGASYADLLRDRFFRPLGMTSAFVRPARLADFPQPRTLGYRREGTRLEPNDPLDREGFHGGSNLYLSARDLHRWSLSFLRGSPLAPPALTRTHEPASIAGRTSALTLGSWYYTPDRRAFWYSGHHQGFHSEVFRDVSAGVSIAYVSNNTLEPWLQKGIVRAVRAVLAQAGAPPLEPPAVDAVRSDELASLAGLWRFDRGSDLVITGSADALFAERDGIRYRIFQVGDEWFYAPGLDLLLGFAKGPEVGRRRIYAGSSVDERWGELARAPR